MVDKNRALMRGPSVGPHVSQSLSTNLEKWEFAEPQASGILSPAYWRGGKFNSPGRTCLGVARRAKTEALGLASKNVSEPRPPAGRQGSEAAKMMRRWHRCGLAPFRSIIGGCVSPPMPSCRPAGQVRPTAGYRLPQADIVGAKRRYRPDRRSGYRSPEMPRVNCFPVIGK